MSDYTIQWYLDRGDEGGGDPTLTGWEPLPIVSPELGQYLIDKWGYTEKTCPNHLSVSKVDGSHGALVVSASYLNEFLNSSLSPSGFANFGITRTLRIVYTPVSILADADVINKQDFQIEIRLTGVKEVLPKIYSDDDDLVLIEIDVERESNLAGEDGWQEYPQNATTRDNGKIETGAVKNILLEDGFGIGFGYPPRYDVSKMFNAEQNVTGAFQEYSDLIGSKKDIVKDYVDRTENILFHDKDGKIIVQAISTQSNSVKNLLNRYCEHLLISNTMPIDLATESVALISRELEGIWYADTNQNSLVTETYNGFLYPRFPVVDGFKAKPNINGAVYPVTSPKSINWSDRRFGKQIRQRILDQYAAEIKRQAAIAPKYYLFAGNLDFEWKSQITDLSYNNNPFNVTTEVNISLRHRKPYYTLPEYRVSKGFSTNFCEFSASVNTFRKRNGQFAGASSIKDLNVDEDYYPDLSISRLTDKNAIIEDIAGGAPRILGNDIFGLFQDPLTKQYKSDAGIILKQPGIYTFNIPIEYQFSDIEFDPSETTTLVSDGGSPSIAFTLYQENGFTVTAFLTFPIDRNSIDIDQAFALDTVGRQIIKKDVVLRTDFASDIVRSSAAPYEQPLVNINGTFSLGSNVTPETPASFRVSLTITQEATKDAGQIRFQGDTGFILGAESWSQTGQMPYIFWSPNSYTYPNLQNVVLPPGRF